MSVSHESEPGSYVTETGKEGQPYYHTTKIDGEKEIEADPSPCPGCAAFDTVDGDGVVVRRHEQNCPVYIQLTPLQKRPPGA
ncbi:MAG: hypothetical protein ACRDWE_00830 [Acidimicrobiales bacterium]